MNGLVAISGCGCGAPRPVGQTTAAAAPSRTPAFVALGVLALAVGFAFMTEPKRR